MIFDDPEAKKALDAAAKHLISRLGVDEAERSGEVGLIAGFANTGKGSFRHLSGAAHLAYMAATFMVYKAKGRKLGNPIKAKKIAACAELLRDAADLLDKIALPEAEVPKDD